MILLRITLVCAALYLVVLVVVALNQRSLMYHPWTGRPPPPEGFAAITLTVPAGDLVAWYRPAASGRPTILFCDGNGGALAGAADFTRGLAEAGYGLLLVSYPGYDDNPGKPSEDALYATGRAALAWLDQRGIASPVLLGYSLGSGVAVQMATEHPVRALVLLAPFASMTRMAALRYPFLPTTLLLKDRFASEDKIGGLHVPLLVVHGDADPVVPIAEGRRLFAAANPPKRFIVQPGASHLLDMAPIVPEIESFLAAAPAAEAKRTALP